MKATNYRLPLSSNPEAVPFPAPGTVGTDEELAIHFPGDCAWVARRLDEIMYRASLLSQHPLPDLLHSTTEDQPVSEMQPQ